MILVGLIRILALSSYESNQFFSSDHLSQSLLIWNAENQRINIRFPVSIQHISRIYKGQNDIGAILLS